jgi:site-specific recombinase XerD
MTLLAATMQGFFTHHLIGQRRASPNTVASYRDTMRLLVRYAHTETGKTPSQLDLGDLDAKMIGRFLDHLEHDRHNSVNTRNNRLAAIHSLFAYAAFEHPDHAEVIARVLAIPPKKTDRRLVSFLTDPEVEALIAAPNRQTWTGRRDHAMITTAITTGLRVSELAAITTEDLHLGVGAHLRCPGKGRKERITPLTAETVNVITVWLAERQHSPGAALFPSRRGSLSRVTDNGGLRRGQQRPAPQAFRQPRILHTVGTPPVGAVVSEGETQHPATRHQRKMHTPTPPEKCAPSSRCCGAPRGRGSGTE